MSNKLLQVHFAFSGPFGDEMSAQLAELAQSINRSRFYLEDLDGESRHAGSRRHISVRR